MGQAEAVAGCGLRVAGGGWRVAGCGLWVAGCGLRVVGGRARLWQPREGRHWKVAPGATRGLREWSSEPRQGWIESHRYPPCRNGCLATPASAGLPPGLEPPSFHPCRGSGERLVNPGLHPGLLSSVAPPGAATDGRGHPQPATRHPQPTTRHPQPATRNPQPATHNPQPTTRNPPPATPQPTTHPQPATHNPQPTTHNPQPATRNPQPATAAPG